MIPLAQEYDVAIAGGDTNSWDGPLAVSVTVFGAVGRAVPCGAAGRGRATESWLPAGSAAASWGTISTSSLGSAKQSLLGDAYELHAGIDVSDGLSLDLAHLAEESGCGAVVEMARVPVSDDARRLADELADGSTPLDHALGDGEDFELILAVAPRRGRANAGAPAAGNSAYRHRRGDCRARALAGGAGGGRIRCRSAAGNGFRGRDAEHRLAEV